MSIAELIMQGTQRSSETTSWVGDSLAKLGQNVGQALAQREQQKQAQEMLPMFQQNMQDAMILANKGDAGLAYAKLMPFLADPAVANNPYMMRAIPAFEKGIEFAAESYARNIRAEAYRDRYSGGGGGEGGSQEDIISAFTQGAPRYTDAEMAAQDVTDQVGETTAVVSPRVLYQGDIARRLAGLPATQGAGGFPFEKIKEEAMQRGGSQEPNMEAIPVEALLPGEQPATRPQGPVNPLKNEPSPDTIKAFKRYSENFLNLPLRGQIEDRNKASIIFDNKTDIDKYVQSKQGERQFIEVANEASVAVPGVFGVELPKEISKFVVAGGSLGRNGFTYRIDERQEGSKKAQDAVAWLNEWQQKSVKAESNTDIRNLLNQAGNDALNIEVSEKPISEDDERIAYNVQVKDKPQTAIQVSKDVYNDILQLKLQTSAAKTHGAKFLRMEQTPDKSSAQPTKRRVKVLADKGGRYYLNAKGQKVYIK